MSKTINLAVIGAGYWGIKLITEYTTLSRKRNDLRLYAVADSSSNRLQNVGERFSFPRSMLKNEYKEILEDPEVNGVHIATPNETHYEFAMKAIEAGKNVLLEKPMCLTSSDAFRLARYAEKSNVVLLIGHIFRFNNAINKLKQMIEKKEINGCRCVELRWTSLMPPPPDRDIIFDLAPHPIDILNHLFEEWPSEVYVKGRSFERKRAGLEEVIYAAVDFPKDILASLTLSWIHHGPRQRTIYLVNEKSAVKVEAVEQTITFYEDGRTTEIPVQQNNTIEDEINHFVNRIRENIPPINSSLTGVMNVKVLEAMNKSLHEDKATTVI